MLIVKKMRHKQKHCVPGNMSEHQLGIKQKCNNSHKNKTTAPGICGWKKIHNKIVLDKKGDGNKKLDPANIPFTVIDNLLFVMYET